MNEHRWRKIERNGAFDGWLCVDCGRYVASPYRERRPLCAVPGEPRPERTEEA